MREIRHLLLALSQSEASCEKDASDELLEFDKDLGNLSVYQIPVGGVHQFIERIQQRLITVTADLSGRISKGLISIIS
ncbi:MAG: hypothetical protein ACK4MV_12820 [Beijerinckiaceae bacterium]